MATPRLIERTLHRPQSVFETPEAVLRSDQLPREHKRAVLERWCQLVGSSSPSQAETVAGGAPDLATRLARALAFLDTETDSHGATHEQGFYTSIGDIGKEQPSKDW
jgi:hypothetical protein